MGAMALFVVLSVFSGLKEFSLSFTNEIDPDLKATPTLGKSFFVTPKQDQEIKKIAGIASFSKIIEERVLFTFADKQEVTYLKGVDTQFTKVNAIEKKIVQRAMAATQHLSSCRRIWNGAKILDGFV